MNDIVKRIKAALPKRLRPNAIRATLRQRKLLIEKHVYRTSVSEEEFKSALLRMGEWRGRVVFVQSSWDQFYNIRLTPRQCIALLLDMVGPQGTLVMPTFPLFDDPAQILDIDSVPSKTGLLTETFRRWPGAHRSIHLTSAVSAVGPAAQSLVCEHHLDPYSWGPQTPYGKMIERNALLLLLGTDAMAFTPLHNVECVLRHDIPAFNKIWGPAVTYRWRKRTGETGTHSFHSRLGKIRPSKLVAAYPRALYRTAKLSNLTLQAMDAAPGVELAKKLARKGITIYPRF